MRSPIRQLARSLAGLLMMTLAACGGPLEDEDGASGAPTEAVDAVDAVDSVGAVEQGLRPAQPNRPPGACQAGVGLTCFNDGQCMDLCGGRPAPCNTLTSCCICGGLD